ncbi:MAG: hypothetical protein K0B01_14830 [Syntrophobacterales bacterium]|nr:hypothetical protein [Syntrophobacterales bacterium]
MKSTIETQELASKASHNITSRLVWHTALKDQAGIAQSLADGKDIQEIYGLGEAALFDIRRKTCRDVLAPRSLLM